ncbi:collagen alpha-1(XII) chain-like isoform X2 [Dreissena polymorpha]|uniref:collagen alpha-1(XII) chain-like isoform X2 n=1 Tax=Dreissena polymorpha TaxID=45954 RepID=UPI0022648104|nr:collagen alpha-1(XII) chain-like isoform X2 [Dreissena polymorpha]
MTGYVIETVLWCLVVTVSCLVVTVSAQTEDDHVNQMVLPQNTAESTNTIASFVGFTCPKGHRCLPVIECLPCDYGYYKDTEGSELCSQCPAGCTTLRKGAETWRECVPKCPPGYEESECSKTCTKCRPGFYKPSWENVPCTRCPDDVMFYEDDVGMTSVEECRGNKTLTTTTPRRVTPTAPPETTTENWATTELPSDDEIVCHDYTADIVIVIDGSGSIEKEDFKKQLEFVGDIIGGLNARSRANIAVVAFSSEVYDYVYLDQFADKDALKHRTMNFSQQGLATYTGKALKFVVEDILSVRHGDRPFAQDIVLVITDGMSTDPVDMRKHAELLKKKATKVFAVAVGDFNATELENIASKPEYIFHVENFDALNTIYEDLKKWSCADNTAGCIQGAICSRYEHDEIRLRLMFGTNCTSFCHCATLATHENATVTYYWERQNCPLGTQFDESIKNCNHPENVMCNDGWMSGEGEPPTNTITPTPAWTTDPTTDWTDTTGEVTFPTDTPPAEEETIVCHDYSADIVVVIDGSGSIVKDDFRAQLQFVSDMVMDLNASARARVAVVAFSNEVYEYVYLQQYLNKTALAKRVMQFTQQGLATYTGQALKFVVEEVLNAANGDRPNAQDVVLVVTDGKSTDPEDLLIYADQLKQKASKVFAVGVGSYELSELKEIASDPAYVYEVDSFDALDSISDNLRRQSCADKSAGCRERAICSQYEHDEIRLRLMHGTNCTSFCHCATLATHDDATVTYYWERQNCSPGTQFDSSKGVCNHVGDFVCEDGWMSGEGKPPTNTTTLTPAWTTDPTTDWTDTTGEVTLPTDMPPAEEETIVCHDYSADIVVVIDGSGSIVKEDFRAQLQFVSDMVMDLNASARARVAVVAFSDEVYEYVYLQQYLNKTALAKRVLQFTQQGLATYTGEALKFVVEEVLNAVNGDRPNAKDVVLVVTDGKSTDPGDLLIYAEQLKQKASKVFAVGVGSYELSELKEIASDPAYVYEVDSFDALDSISDNLRRESCADKSAGCRERAICSQYEHDEIRLRLMHGTNCTSFCHCATLATHDDATVTYYWERQNCSPGTQFDSSKGVCNHVGDFVCEDGWLTTPAQSTQPTPTTPIDSGFTDTTTIQADVDEVTDPTTGCPIRTCSGVEYYALPGCKGFCQCNDATKKWVQHLCNVPHELFNEDVKNCDHQYNVNPTTCTAKTT